MQALIDKFLDYIILEKGLSKSTASSYASDLKKFKTFLETKNIEVFNKVTKKDIIDFLLAEKNKRLTESSIAREFVTIRVFFKFLSQEKFITNNPTEFMDSPKLWKVLPSMLSESEVDLLLSSPQGNKPTMVRDKALLELMYATGLRVSEICNIKVEDLHFDAGYLNCIGKGNKERIVPFSENTANILKNYIINIRPLFCKNNNERTLFLSQLGKPINRKTVWKNIKKYAKDCRITKNISPHTLRHAFASHLLSHGAPLRIIQELLGHSDISTTQIYTHTDQNRLISIHRKYHPRA